MFVCILTPEQTVRDNNKLNQSRLCNYLHRIYLFNHKLCLKTLNRDEIKWSVVELIECLK